ncbi:DUF1801 domain-containing protein [Sphaerotilus microaerophilus]|uniref:YdhG-like domain-containing protein n=1 Tax=Sphaerotilus microaerophilus TaxID=2914710 RepID=A0ABM7YLG7_9BURK|nr:DUF1801 domain-containing protein [Sphaerotilus sp. FB-5]BDI05281.1 hypothetical protein CATMQ487_22510 [Sphaerotilus sp. FB-5]
MTRPKASQDFAAGSGAVDALLAALEHPNKEGIQLLRKAILELDARIREEVKWNAPSFALDDHFATFKLHPPGKIQLVLHTGAKPKAARRQFALQGEQGLVKWAAPDRCVVNIGSTDAARDHSHVVVDLVGQWIRQLSDRPRPVAP